MLDNILKIMFGSLMADKIINRQARKAAMRDPKVKAAMKDVADRTKRLSAEIERVNAMFKDATKNL